MKCLTRRFLSTTLAATLALGSLTIDANDKSLRIFHQKIDGGYRVYAQSADDFPRSAQITVTSLKNLRSTSPNPFQTVIKNGTRPVFLFDLQVIKPRSGTKFNFQYDFVSGDFTSARHDDSHVYLLPFEHGTKHLLTQGYHGKFSHSDPGREFAVDFTMPERTAILAARAGTVLKVRTDSKKGGAAKAFEEDGNYITILHEDGSLAEYVHLIHSGSFVRVGEQVAAGQRIGLSGNTGRSTGPHLHFHVGVPTASGKLRTLPTRFRNHRNEAVSPQEGETYYANHPGKPAFKATTRSEIQHTSFQDHRAGIPRENKISTRAETSDGTVVIYLRNGYAETKEVLLTLPTMENLTPSKAVPLSMTLEPQTERFAVVLKQSDVMKPFRYATEWQYRAAR